MDVPDGTQLVFFAKYLASVTLARTQLEELINFTLASIITWMLDYGLKLTHQSRCDHADAETGLLQSKPNGQRSLNHHEPEHNVLEHHFRPPPKIQKLSRNRLRKIDEDVQRSRQTDSQPEWPISVE